MTGKMIEKPKNRFGDDLSNDTPKKLRSSVSPSRHYLIVERISEVLQDTVPMNIVP